MATMVTIASIGQWAHSVLEGAATPEGGAAERTVKRVEGRGVVTMVTRGVVQYGYDIITPTVHFFEKYRPRGSGMI